MESTSPDPVRWAITFFDVKKGYRTLVEPAQGRYTYATKEEAEEYMRILEPSLREKILGDQADSLAVLPVECWPGHHDPKRTVFSFADLMGAIFWDTEREFLSEFAVPREHLDPPSSSHASLQSRLAKKEKP